MDEFKHKCPDSDLSEIPNITCGHGRIKQDVYTFLKNREVLKNGRPFGRVISSGGYKFNVRIK